jgi:hypothetical protein
MTYRGFSNELDSIINNYQVNNQYEVYNYQNKKVPS